MLVALEDIAGVDFGGDVGEAGVEAVGDDGVGLRLELLQIVHHEAAEEGGAVLEGGLVDDHLGPLGLDALHHALDRRLAEVVGVGLHRQTVDADHALTLAVGAPVAVGVVPSGLLQHAVGDEVLSGAVALNDGPDQVLGDVGVIRQQLLGVLRQTVASVTEGGVVVVGSDTGIETDSLDDGLRVETLYLGISVQLVEVADAKGEIGVGEELDGLCFLGPHVERGNVLFQCSLFEQSGESVRGIGHAVDVGDGENSLVGSTMLIAFHELGGAGHDAAGIEVVVERLALAQELGEEEEVEFLRPLGGVLHIQATAVSYGYGGLYHHHCIGIDF